MAKTSVLFVCMGNSCRSPTAEGVFRHRVEAAGLSDQFRIDSAGTRGYDLSAQRSRKVAASDFEEFVSI